MFPPSQLVVMLSRYNGLYTGRKIDGVSDVNGDWLELLRRLGQTKAIYRDNSYSAHLRTVSNPAALLVMPCRDSNKQRFGRHNMIEERIRWVGYTVSVLVHFAQLYQLMFSTRYRLILQYLGSLCRIKGFAMFSPYRATGSCKSAPGYALSHNLANNLSWTSVDSGDSN